MASLINRIDRRPDKKYRQVFIGGPAAAGGGDGKQVTGSLAGSLTEGVWAGSLYEVRVGVCPGLGPEWWIRWFAHRFGGVSAGGMCGTLLLLPTPYFLLLALQECQLGFLVSMYLVAHNLSHLRMHAVAFSPLRFRCVLLLEETFVQVRALQRRVSGPSLFQLYVPGTGLGVGIQS